MLLNITLTPDVFVRVYSGYRITIANHTNAATVLKAGTVIFGFGKVWGPQSNPTPAVK
jgi:hypothetical protein